MSEIRFLFRVLVVLLRFVTGMPLDGKRRTDATFFRRGTMVTDPHWFGAGIAWWSMLPGCQRAAVRVLPIAAVVGWFRDRVQTEWAAAVVLGPLCGWLIWKAIEGIMLGRHRRVVIKPLAAALAPALESSPPEVERALWVPRRAAVGDQDAQVVAMLPDGWQGHDGQRETATRIVGHRLGGSWESHVQRSPLALVIRRKPEPPRLVDFAEIADLIRNEGSATRILMGLAGGGDPYWLDFKDLIVNLGVSVGTGGGKSSFLRFLIAQAAYWGVADFPVIDSKMVSLAGMEAVPGIRIYDEVPDQWAAIERLAADVDARYRWLKEHPGYEFPMCMPVLEEQNDFAIASRAAWLEQRASRDPMTPPIYQQLTRIVIKGRQVGYRTSGVYQRLTAESCGGLSAPVMRDSYGGKALAWYSQQSWDSLTGLRPWIPPTHIKGRWVIVTGNQAHQVQVPRNEPGELVDFVLSSPHLVRDPVDRPWAGAAAAEPVQDRTAESPGPSDQATVRAGSADDLADLAEVRTLRAAPRYLTQAEVADRLGMGLPAFTKWRQRCRSASSPLPEPLYLSGRPLWTDDQLEEMAHRRRSA